MMQGWYYVKSLTGQRHDRVQTESQQLQPWTAVSTLLGLVSTVRKESLGTGLDNAGCKYHNRSQQRANKLGIFLNIQNFAGIFSQLSIYNFDLEETGVLVTVSCPILLYLSYSGACLTTSRKEMHGACRKPKNWKTAEQDEKKNCKFATLGWPLTQHRERNLTGCILAFSLSCLWGPSCICPCQNHITSPGWYASILA